MSTNNALAVKIPNVHDVIASLSDLAFIVEGIAHLQGKEKELLPYCENARQIIDALSVQA